MLLFKKKFLEQIRRGEKTQTIRLWDRRRMKSGQRSYVPGIGYIAIVSVEPVELSGLTDDDAAFDGFSSAEVLREEIYTLYTDEIREKCTPFRVRFSVYPPEKQQEITDDRKRRKQQNLQQQNKDVHQTEFVSQTLEKLKRMSR